MTITATSLGTNGSVVAPAPNSSKDSDLEGKSWEQSFEDISESCLPCGTASELAPMETAVPIPPAPAEAPPASAAVPPPSPDPVPATEPPQIPPIRRVPSSDDPESLRKPIPAAAEPPPAAIAEERRPSILSKLKHRRPSADGEVPPDLWGLPGYLTDEEVAAYMELYEIIKSRPPAFRKAMFSFGEEEDEPYCLCRWLRARKFVVEDVVKMVTEATQVLEAPSRDDFYPDGGAALGVPVDLYMTQYPQLYAGNARNGCPVFYSKPGLLDVDAIECMTTLDRLVKFHWHVYMHDFGDRLRLRKNNDPEFHRFECLSVLDLAGLTPSKLGRKVIKIVEDQAKIDSLCFPETMNKMLIINAPGYFSASWSLIKTFLDIRTRNKIDVISDRKKWEKRLRELVSPDQIPSDYGGTATSTHDLLLSEGSSSAISRRYIETVSLRSTHSSQIELTAGEEMTLAVHTKAEGGASFDVISEKKEPIVTGKEVVHPAGVDLPTRVEIGKVRGPGNFKIKCASHTSRFSSELYLIVGECRGTAQGVGSPKRNKSKKWLY